MRSKTRALSAVELRQRSENRLRRELSFNTAGFSPDKIPELIHELRAYQIELEMQNEELRRRHL